MGYENDIEFFTWLRKIEFERLKKYYLTMYHWDKELNELTKYLNYGFKSYDENEFNFLIKKIKINKKNKVFTLKLIDILEFIRDYLKGLTEENYIPERLDNIIFFIQAYAINTNYDFKLWTYLSEISECFLIRDKDGKRKDMPVSFKWGATGVKILRENSEIIIRVGVDKRKLLVFEMAFFLLREFSTLQIMKEIFLTGLYKFFYEKDKYLLPIENEYIIKYFKNNQPFFKKLLDEAR